MASEDGPWANETVSYAYDNGRRRTSLSLQQPRAAAWAPSYAYDAAGNLTRRTQNVLTHQFSLSSLNQITRVGRSGTFTVAGPVQGTASSVTGNGSAATFYADQTFARTNVTLANGTNTFTAVATDSRGRWDTNTVTAYLPATLTSAHDLNGNLRTNGTRWLDFDDGRLPAGPDLHDPLEVHWFAPAPGRTIQFSSCGSSGFVLAATTSRSLPSRGVASRSSRWMRLDRTRKVTTVRWRSRRGADWSRALQPPSEAAEKGATTRG